MEWVETTAKTIEAAKDQALDRLGVAGDDAEFEVLEEPRQGLFGRVRGEARVRARVRPTAVRPKQERRGRQRSGGKQSGGQDGNRGNGRKNGQAAKNGASQNDAGDSQATGDSARSEKSNGQRRSQSGGRSDRPQKTKENTMDQESTVTPQEVGDAAVAFMSGLADAFGSESTTNLTIDETELEVRVEGDDLGLMIGPGGRTLNAIQDLARVAAQRRLGDHETRLRVDVAGYREKRREALENFTRSVAQQVLDSGVAKAMEPMPSADRKVVHDAVTEIEGVESRSDGDDPGRRVVIAPTQR